MRDKPALLRILMILFLLSLGPLGLSCGEEEGEEADAASEDGESPPTEAAKEGEAPKEGEAAPAKASAPAQPPAKIKVLNTMSAETPLEIRVDGKALPNLQELKGVPGTLLDTEAAAGPRWFSLHTPSQERVELASMDAELTSGRSYLMLLAGDAYNPGPRSAMRLLYDDQVQEHKPQQAVVRFINASPDLPALDVLLQPPVPTENGSDKVMFVNIGFGKGSVYRAIDPGTKLMTMRSAFEPEGGFSELEQVEIQPGDKIMMVITGGPRLDNDTVNIQVIRK